MEKYSSINYYQKYISDFDGYSCQFSPFEKNKYACCFSQYYGIVGNGRLSVFEINQITGIPEEVKRFNTTYGIYDLCWSENNENLIVTAGADGIVSNIFTYFKGKNI